MSNEYSAPSEYAPTYVQLERAYKDLKEQRAELLEALKESTEMLTSIMEGEDWGAIEEQIVDNQEAINKAEASE